MAALNDSVNLVRGEGKRFIKFLIGELKPKGKVFTPFNIVGILVIALAAILVVIRFAKGLGSVTNLSQEYPWGLWIGFDV